MTRPASSIETMAFYNPDGFVPAFKQATRFAGDEGHIATLPEVIAARMSTKPGSVPWESYFTTMSAEYVGLSKEGKPIAIVAHGIGPMATLDGVLAAYGHEFKDRDRNRRGGRISQEEFHKLEDGEYGEVHIVDLLEVWSRRPYQFSGHAVTTKELAEEPLWKARLGPKWAKYCVRHAVQAAKWREQRRLPDLRADQRECILAMDDASNCSYSTPEMFFHWIEKTPGTAIAHLLSIGGLCNSRHDYYEYDYRQREGRESLANDVSCHEWSNGVRLAAVRGEKVDDIHPGIGNMRQLMAKYWQKLVHTCDAPPTGFFSLMHFGDNVFTQYPKKGARMDTHDPELRVTKMERVEGGPEIFRTTVGGGYHGFFRFEIDEVRRVAPQGANAYLLPGEIEIEWDEGTPMYHVASIEFYHVEIDTSQRMMLVSEIYHDFELMMWLIEAEEADAA